MLQNKQTTTTKKTTKTKIKGNKQTKKLPVTMGMFNLKSIQVIEALLHNQLPARVFLSSWTSL